MVREMFAPAEFSPDAHLTEALTIGETAVMHLDDTTYLPTGPGIVILNDAASPEIIRYETRSLVPAELRTLTREYSKNGAVGAAAAHVAGTAVYRGDTALDDLAFKENIEYLYEKQTIGIEWDRNGGSVNHTELTLIDDKGNPLTSLPFTSFDNHIIYNGIRRCVLARDGNPTFGSNGRGDGLVLNGSTGRVMVAIPKFWVRSESPSTGVYRWWISPVPQSGFEVHPAFKQRGGIERNFIYVSAYEAPLMYRDYPAHTPAVKAFHSRTGDQPGTGNNCIKYLAYTSGGVAPFEVGHVLKQGAATAVIVDWTVSTGAWTPSQDAAGEVMLRKHTTNFVAGNLDLYEPDGVTLLQSNVCTVAGAATPIPMTADQARTYAENVGPGWGAENIYTYAARKLLQLIEFQTMNLQVALGKGVVNLAANNDYGGALTGAGGADGSIETNGTGKGSGVDGEATICWRGIENPWGNINCLVDGLWNSATTIRQVNILTGGGLPSAKMPPTTTVAFESPPTLLPSGPGGITDIMYDDLTKYLFLPKTVETIPNYAQYCCDEFANPLTVSSNAYCGGGWMDGLSAGPFYTDFTFSHVATPTSRNGVRLEYIGPRGSPGLETMTIPFESEAVFPPPPPSQTVPQTPYITWSDASNSGVRAWLAPAAVMHQDGGGCRCAGRAAGSPELTHLLRVQGFRLNIPAGATITSVVPVIYKWQKNSDASNYVRDTTVSLILPGGELLGNQAATVTSWTGTYSAPTQTLYNGVPLWGKSDWTPEILNHGDFGVAVAVTVTNPGHPTPTVEAAIDYVGLWVTYTI